MMKWISVIVLVCSFATVSYGATDEFRAFSSSAYSSIKALYQYISIPMDVHTAFASATDSMKQFKNGNYGQSFLSAVQALHSIFELTGINRKVETSLRATINNLLLGSEQAAKDWLNILNTVLNIATHLLWIAEFIFPDAAPIIELVRIVLTMMQSVLSG